MYSKKLLLCVLATISLCGSAAAQLKSEVNECFELTSIVFRLAGAEEYVVNDLPKYTSAIDTHFAPYKTHPVVAYCQKMRREQSIGYDAVAGAGAFIEIKNGIVKSKSQGPFLISEKQSRWTEKSFTEFVKLLNDFYEKSEFSKFYASQAAVRDLAQLRYDSLLQRADADWFVSFFGGDPVKFQVVLSLCNGPNNYGFSNADGSIGSVIGTGSDQNGDPFYSNYMILLFVHETLHGYVNQLVDENWGKIKEAAEEMFPNIEQRMRQIAYGNAKTAVIEWMVRLATLSYAKDHPALFQQYTLDDLISNEQQQGFVWMDRSVAAMGEFYNNRDKYPTFVDFLPQIIEHINLTCKNYKAIAEEYQNSGPSVVSFSPGVGDKIFASTEKIIFKFSEPMKSNMSLSITPKMRNGQPYWQDSTTFVVLVNCYKLDENETGEIILMTHGHGFVSEKGTRMRQPFSYAFTVDKQ